MNIILFICILYCGLALANTNIEENLDITPRSINEQILEAIEKFKKQMPCGIPDAGVPVLAPFEQTYAEFEYNKKFLQAIGSFFDLRVDGLNDFYVNKIALSVLTLKGSFDVTFTELKAKSEYVANAFLLKYIKISGKGDMNVQLKDLRIVGDFQIGSNSSVLYLKKFKVVVALGGFKSDITGLLWGKLTGKLANYAIQKFVPYMIKHKQQEISTLVEDAVITRANEMLKELTIKDILDMIQNAGDWPECNPKPNFYYM